MSLDNYQRDNIYSKSISTAFDKYIEVDEEEIVQLLDRSDMIILDRFPERKLTWKQLMDTSNPPELEKLTDRFTIEVTDNHKQFFMIVGRFVQEHTKEREAVIIMLKNQIRYIKDVIRRLDIDYFDVAENSRADFIFQFRDIVKELLDKLIESILTEYKIYLKDESIYAEYKSIEELDLVFEDFVFTSAANKVVLLNELGIIDYLKENNPSLKENNTWLANIISKFTEEKVDTLRRAILDMKKGAKNDPYKNERNTTKVENLFNTYKIDSK